MNDALLDDIQSSGYDTRDLLGEMRGSLEELLRLLHHFQPQNNNTGEQKELSRRVLFQLFKAGDLSQEITAGLADFTDRIGRKTVPPHTEKLQTESLQALYWPILSCTFSFLF